MTRNELKDIIKECINENKNESITEDTDIELIEEGFDTKEEKERVKNVKDIKKIIEYFIEQTGEFDAYISIIKLEKYKKSKSNNIYFNIGSKNNDAALASGKGGSKSALNYAVKNVMYAINSNKNEIISRIKEEVSLSVSKIYLEKGLTLVSHIVIELQ